MDTVDAPARVERVEGELMGEGTLFAGDIADHDHHAYLADARYASWPAALARLEQRLDEDVTLHPGHGVPAGRAVLGAQRRSVEAFLDAVAEHGADEDAVAARMRPLVADDRLEFLMRLSVAPVHQALFRG